MGNVRVYRSGDENKVRVAAPFFPAMVDRARSLGGRWDRKLGEWVFDARDEVRIREALFEVYGTDGSPVPVKTVRMRVTHHYDQQLFGFGRELASRRSRDDAVRLGPGVVVVEGRFPVRGGSRNRPTLISNGEYEYQGPVVLEIRDVPARLADEAIVAGEVEEVESEGQPGGLSAAEQSIVTALLSLSDARRDAVLSATQLVGTADATC